MKFGVRLDIKEIELRNASSRDPDGTVWFKNVNLKFTPGDTVVMRGEAVASHLLKMIAGLTPPTEGQVLINGIDIHEMAFEEFLPIRLNIGYSFNLGGILNNRTIKENLMLPFLFHGASHDFAEKEVREILERFDMTRYQDIRPAGVPGVVRKLCCIGRALAITPQVLLMDDPTSSMKPYAVQGLRDWVTERRREYPLFLLVASEHDELFKNDDHKTVVIEHGGAHWQNSSQAAAS
jgi:phospholipid/cholesterol/gamma-HCH transport system ATP-binding protein